MGQMMNNPMIQSLMKNPDFMKTASSLMQSSGGDMSKMKDLMQSSPEMQNLLKDPTILKESLNMFRDPKNKAMLDMMVQQNPSMKPMVTLMNTLGWGYDAYQGVKRWSTSVVGKVILFGLLLLAVAYYFR